MGRDRAATVAWDVTSQMAVFGVIGVAAAAWAGLSLAPIALGGAVLLHCAAAFLGGVGHPRGRRR